jgi:hypothetical protein
MPATALPRAVIALDEMSDGLSGCRSVMARLKRGWRYGHPSATVCSGLPSIGATQNGAASIACPVAPLPAPVWLPRLMSASPTPAESAKRERASERTVISPLLYLESMARRWRSETARTSGTVRSAYGETRRIFAVLDATGGAHSGGDLGATSHRELVHDPLYVTFSGSL